MVVAIDSAPFLPRLSVFAVVVKLGGQRCSLSSRFLCLQLVEDRKRFLDRELAKVREAGRVGQFAALCSPMQAPIPAPP